ncbi:hypothetical protein KIN20_022144 [Parelaphostrongylus tenuis]|uniref:Uncharacterized protein n=1 Tax=Parelaphostrongylus tenuis TaxID=148309 RepID=A0AAD5MPT1_PARTN|nr:hypothetical protein KIN20_022144 [Parelaphostrongylus tenuis]
MQEKLRKGERRAVQNRNGVMVLNGSTREKCRRFQQHTVRVNSGTKKFGVAESYNNNMGFVDLMDQMAAYSPFFRSTKNNTCICYLAS